MNNNNNRSILIVVLVVLTTQVTWSLGDVGSNTCKADTTTYSPADLNMNFVAREEVRLIASGTKVYFAGGKWEADSGSPKPTRRKWRVDVYDTSTDTWSIAYLSAPRDELTLVRTGNYVLFAGGQGQNGTDSQVVDVLDTTTNAWTATMLPEVKKTGKSVQFMTVSDTAYTIFADSRENDKVDVWNRDTQTWSTGVLSGGSTRSPKYVAGKTRAVVYQGQNPTTFTTYFDRVTVFSAGAWSASAFPNTPPELDDGAATTDGYLVLPGKRSADVVVYNENTDAWSTTSVPNFSTVNGGVAVGAVGTRVFLAGGLTSLTSFTVTDVVSVYVPSTGVWSTATLSVARTNMDFFKCGTTRGVFYGGRSGPSTESAAVDVYSSADNSWTTTTVPGGARKNYAAGCDASGTKFFVGFGTLNDAYVKSVRILDLASMTWTVYDSFTDACPSTTNNQPPPAPPAGSVGTGASVSLQMAAAADSLQVSTLTSALCAAISSLCQRIDDMSIAPVEATVSRVSFVIVPPATDSQSSADALVTELKNQMGDSGSSLRTNSDLSSVDTTYGVQASTITMRECNGKWSDSCTTSVSVASVIVMAICGVLTLVAIVAVVYRYSVYRRRRLLSYEKDGVSSIALTAV